MSSADKSNLSHSRYGYDFVVGTTQRSINATMKKYLDKLAAGELKDRENYLVFKRVGKGKDRKIERVDHAKFVAEIGVDPFSLDADVDTEGPIIQKLGSARFAAGIKITLGLPQNFEDPRKLPSIVDLEGGTEAVTFNMMCANLETCELEQEDGEYIWTRTAQNDKPEKAWIFQSKVDLRLDTANFEKLPEAVKKGVRRLDGNMFEVKQLLFDLTQPTLSSVPKLEGVDPASNVALFMTKYFVNSYFEIMRRDNGPVLDYVVRDKVPRPSSFVPTSFNFHVNDNNGLDPELRTLNYLCATEGRQLPPAVRMDWDWVSPADSSQQHGAIAINRNTFARFIFNELYEDTRAHCFMPVVKCEPKGLGVSFNAYAGPAPASIDKDLPKEGSTIIKLWWKKEEFDYAGLDGALGHTGLRNEYYVDVSVSGNKMTVVTHAVVHLSVKSLQTKNASNIVDVTYTDSYEFAIDADGQMQVKFSRVKQDWSVKDSANAFVNFFTDVNEIFDALSDRDYKVGQMSTDSIEAFQSFIFPGGDTFTFKNFHFSEHQDLLAAITYVDPSL